jgi:hypothetical protein
MDISLFQYSSFSALSSSLPAERSLLEKYKTGDAETCEAKIAPIFSCSQGATNSNILFAFPLAL